MKQPHAIRRNLVSILLCIAVQSASLAVATPRAAGGSDDLSLVASAAEGRSAIRQSPVSNDQPSTSLTYTLYLPAIAYTHPPLSSAGVEASGSGTSYTGQISRMSQAGAQFTRIAGVWWPDVQATEGVGNYDWSAISWIDSDLAAASAQGLTPILVVRGTPAWAQLYTGYSCGPILESKLSAFGDFMAALVTRYSQPPYNVKYWEMGNEPDVDPYVIDNFASDSDIGCWGDSTDTAGFGGSRYAAMLKVVYPRVKAVDPSAQVLVGGLLLDCDPTPGVQGCQTYNHSALPPLFLTGILAAGGGPYFDGIAFHAYDYNFQVLGVYSLNTFHSTSSTTGPSSAAKAEYLRNVLSAYSVSGKYLLTTESALLCSSCDGVPAYEMTKAYYVAQLYAQSISLDLRVSAWYSVLGWFGRSTALLNTDLSARPAYTAYNAVTTLLGGTSYVGPVTSADVGGAAPVLGYKFTRGGERLWIVWSADAAAHTLTLPTPAQQEWDVFGAPITPTDSVTVTLSPSDRLLVYLEWSP